MASLGLGNTDQFKLVWIDVCYNGIGNYEGVNDMASAWMDLSDDVIHDKLYVSWNDPIFTSNEAVYADWSAFFWGDPDGFGLYGTNTYEQAFTRAQIEVSGIPAQNSIFGTIGDTSHIRFTNKRYD